MNVARAELGRLVICIESALSVRNTDPFFSQSPADKAMGPGY